MQIEKRISVLFDMKSVFCALLSVCALLSCSHAMSGQGSKLSVDKLPEKEDAAPACHSEAVFPEPSSEVYPVAISDAQKMIFEFLSSRDFEILRTRMENGKVTMCGKKGAERWKIDLMAESSTSTAVGLAYSENDKADAARIEKLRNHIMTNVQKVVVESEDTAEYIPPKVLECIESVVCLESVSSEKKTQFSGFIVDPDGLILATAHDLKGHQELNATLYDGRTAQGMVLKADHLRDLALVRVELKSPSRISIEKGRNLLSIGERIYTVGCPVNLRGTVFPGIVNGPPRRVGDQIYWQVAMKIHPGSSGSPVFDAQGNLVALVKGRFRGTDSLGFLIPFETIVEFLKEIKTK